MFWTLPAMLLVGPVNRPIKRKRNRTGENRTSAPRPLDSTLSWALPWTPSWDVSWELSWRAENRELSPRGSCHGRFRGRTRALVGPLVVPLVDPLVGRGSLSPALCVAHKEEKDKSGQSRKKSQKRGTSTFPRGPTWALWLGDQKFMFKMFMCCLCPLVGVSGEGCWGGHLWRNQKNLGYLLGE